MSDRGGPALMSFRWPLLVRFCVGFFGLFWVTMIGRGLVGAVQHGEALGAVLVSAMLAYFPFFAVRMWMGGLYVTEAGILVRNDFKTYQVPREHVKCFRVGPAGWMFPARQTIQIELLDSRLIRVQSTMISRWRSSAALEDNVVRLNAWLRG